LWLVLGIAAVALVIPFYLRFFAWVLGTPALDVWMPVR